MIESRRNNHAIFMFIHGLVYESRYQFPCHDFFNQSFPQKETLENLFIRSVNLGLCWIVWQRNLCKSPFCPVVSSRCHGFAWNRHEAEQIDMHYLSLGVFYGKLCARASWKRSLNMKFCGNFYVLHVLTYIIELTCNC